MDVDRWLVDRLRARLDAQLEDAVLSTSASTAAATQAPMSLDAETVLRTVGRLRAEQRWLYGRPMRACKVGRAELAYVRRHCQAQAGSVLAGILPSGDSLYGIPVYEVDRPSYFEPIYRDAAPTLEALNQRLVQEPAAVWGILEPIG